MFFLGFEVNQENILFVIIIKYEIHTFSVLTQYTIIYSNSKSVLVSNYKDEKQNWMLWK